MRNEFLNLFVLPCGCTHGDDTAFRVGDDGGRFAKSIQAHDRGALARDGRGIRTILDATFQRNSFLAARRRLNPGAGRAVHCVLLNKCFAGACRQYLVGLAQDVFDIGFQSFPEVVLRRTLDR